MLASSSRILASQRSRPIKILRIPASSFSTNIPGGDSMSVMLKTTGPKRITVKGDTDTDVTIIVKGYMRVWVVFSRLQICTSGRDVCIR